MKINIMIAALLIFYSNVHPVEINPEGIPQKNISIEDFFTDAERTDVIDGRIITKSFLKYKDILHTPGTDKNINLPAIKYIDRDLNRYEMICIEKAFYKLEKAQKPGIYLYNILAGFSRLSGMNYYSKTDRKTEPFITACHTIDPAENGKNIQDAHYDSVQPKVMNFFRITDNRFGNLVFKSELFSEGDNFIVKNVCDQPMKKYMISINNKGEYQLISFFIYDRALHGYFYCSINAMRIQSDYFLKLKILSPESFANRIRGSTVHMAELLGLDWQDRIKAFE